MKEKLLILTSRFPYPLEKGDKLRLYQQIISLSKSFDCYLFALHEKEMSKQEIEALAPYLKGSLVLKQSFLKRYWQLFKAIFNKLPFQVSYFYNASDHKKLTKQIELWGIDKIYCQLIRMSPYCTGLKQTKFLDLMDAMSLAMKNRYQTEKWYTKWLYRWEYKKTKRFEKNQINKFKTSFIISQRDQEFIGNDEIIIVKNGVDNVYFYPQKTEKIYDLCFVGNMQYPPNKKAAIFLAQKILPKLPKDTKLLIAGANPSKEIIHLASEQITVSGWMDDIRKAYWESKIMIAPLFSGAGQQNKILEAMASGIPCITTSMVNASILAKNQEEILELNTASEMIEAYKKLIKNSKKQAEIAKNARNFIEKNYHWHLENQKLIENIKNNN